MASIIIDTSNKKKFKATRKVEQPKEKKYQDSIVFDAYEASRSGLSEEGIASLLQIPYITLRRWKNNHPLFALALRKGRLHHTKEDGQVTFRDYVYQRLDPKLQTLWDEINACEKSKSSIGRLEAMFAQHGVKARQHLFLYAFTASNFNASKALQKVGLAKKTLEGWIERDPDFARLMDEIEWHKGNFFESALVRAVKAGETGAILFANRTFNKDRGYGIKVEHTVSGQINHVHTVDVDNLRLDLETKRKLLDAIEAQEAAQPKQIGYEDPSIIDAEFEEKDGE